MKKMKRAGAVAVNLKKGSQMDKQIEVKRGLGGAKRDRQRAGDGNRTLQRRKVRRRKKLYELKGMKS